MKKRGGHSGRARGQKPRALIDQHYPHQVELQIPGTGLGKQLSDRMVEWLRRCDHERRSGTVGRLQDGVDLATFCFRSAAEADGFAADLGGKRIDRIAKLPWPRIT